MAIDASTRESRLRRAYERAGYKLRKSRHRAGFEAGPFYVIDPKLSGAVSRQTYANGMTLKDAEEFLTRLK
jgi:hypothetical protein